jgi:hypothetical protein
MQTGLVFFALVFPLALGAAGIDFARDVRPVLSEHCFACHGPDGAKRKGGLRLDQKESAFAPAESGETAIVPGDVAKSELLRRITSTDQDEVMPPPKEHKKLQPTQVELLRQWIAQGAPWSGHWAFQPVKKSEVPGGKNQQAGAGNPIDAFVLARLEKEGLGFSPEESPERLIRRLSLDLTGLPPTIAEVDAFVREATVGRQSAVENLVDRLLASPHFGERLALPWLDLARYGDTSGYHNDSLRDMWLWREWVIKAFNENKPFSDFTIEQLAGDLLPNATIDQQVASGFHRNVMTSDEGGLIEEEYLNLYITDRVATTGVAWLGLSLGCAQCHDHKYDPITMRDYYQLYAFFASVPESGKDGVRDRNPKPFLRVPTPEQAAQLAQFDADFAAADKAEKELAQSLDAQQAAWEESFTRQATAPEPAGPWVRMPLDVDGHGVTDAGQKVEAAPRGEFTFVEGSVDQSFRVEGTGWLEYGDKFGFEHDQPFSVAAWLRLKPQGGSPFGKMEQGGATRGWDLEFHGTKPSFHLIHHWPGNAIHIQGERDLPADTFLHLAVTYDGSGRAAGVKMFVNGQLEKTKVRIDKLTGTIKTGAPFSIGRRGDAGSAFTGRVDDFRLYSRALDAGEVASLGGGAHLQLLATPAAQRTPEQKAQLKKIYRESFATAYLEAKRRAADLKKARDEFEKTVPNTMVMAEMAKPRDTFIKVRGAYDQNGEKVTTGFPEFLPKPDAPPANGTRYTRLDLARWLASPEHPLTARVAVNRWWAMLFGTGLVKTLNDFGNQGEWPSHPELLDWLAADFARDWDIKRAIRQMVMSRTYRQTSQVSAELLARDAENRLLARGPRQRLDAEIIRDNALAVAGLLDRRLGGKSIKPAQPPGIWEVNEMGGQSYKKSDGPDQYRRGLYVYWRRSTVYPSFITFDAPTREFCSAARPRTSTPLQALVLMNDPVYVEAARAFAQRALREGGSDSAARLDWMWRTALSRPPGEAERAILEKTLARQIADYTQDGQAAQALLKVGDAANPPDVPAFELAAWTAVASVILNLNETITN